MLAYKRPKLNEYSAALTPNGLQKDSNLSPKKYRNRKRKQAISAQVDIDRANEDRLVLCVLLYRASMETLSCLVDDHSNRNQNKNKSAHRCWRARDGECMVCQEMEMSMCEPGCDSLRLAPHDISSRRATPFQSTCCRTHMASKSRKIGGEAQEIYNLCCKPLVSNYQSMVIKQGHLAF